MTQRQPLGCLHTSPPYGGTVPDPIPHLTVGDGLDRSIGDSLERKLIARLPVSTVVESLTLLIEDDDGRWNAARTWPLQRRNVGEA